MDGCELGIAAAAMQERPGAERGGARRPAQTVGQAPCSGIPLGTRHVSGPAMTPPPRTPLTRPLTHPHPPTTPQGMTSAAAAAPPAAPEHSACGESSPAPPPAAGAPAGGAAPPAARRISEDSAQRVPEFDAGSVPPALDYELPKGPMDKAALAKSIWGKELDVSRGFSRS